MRWELENMFIKSYCNSFLPSVVKSHINTQTKLQSLPVSLEHLRLISNTPQLIYCTVSLDSKLYHLHRYAQKRISFVIDDPFVTFTFIQLESIVITCIALSRKYGQ